MPHTPKPAPLAVTALEARDVPAVVAAYSVTQSWGTGYQAEVRLANDGAAPVAFSDLKFSLPSAVQSVWDAKVVSHVGARYGVTNAGWNASVPANGAVTFGLTAAGAAAQATDFVLNGVALGTGVPPVVPPPAPPVTPPPAPAGSALQFAVTSDWGTGLSGELRVKNTGTVPLSNWKLAFDLPATVSSLWNGTVVSHVGTRYTVAPADWNATVAPGATATFGFNASPGGVTATNLTLTVGTNPVPPTPPANHAPVAVADSATTTANTPVTVAVLANDTDADNDALTVTAAGPASHGAVSVNANGTVKYTPAAGYAGADSFTYTVSDGHGGTATGTVSVTVTATAPPPVSAGAWPGKVFAPYVDATLWPTYDVVAAAQATGVKYYTLGFITADPQKRPAWGGYESYSITGTEFDLGMRSRVAGLRALGGDVAVSFGGASGQELAEVTTNVSALTASYRSVITAYNLTHLDFDVEGAALANAAANGRRAQAVATLQQEAAAAGKTLSVRFTLPVLPTGLTADGLALLTGAKTAGVRVDVVNVMAMDYGDSAAPNPTGHMGDYAIQAATSLFSQLGTVYGGTLTDAQRWKLVGVTPMIGRNDVTTEVFDQQAAHQLETWAAQHNVGLLAMWSANRDKQNAAGAIGYVDTASSSIVQTPNEFAGIFGPFTG